MSVTQIESKDMNHTKCEMRFAELESKLEAVSKNHEKLFEHLSNQLNKMRTKQVGIISYLFLSYIYNSKKF